MRRVRWLVAALVAVALLALTAGPASATNGTMSKRQGDFLIRQARIFITATNSDFTWMNWTKARAAMGGSRYWDSKRRDIAGYWFYTGRHIRHLSTAERRNIVDHHWPDPPACAGCAVAGESKRLFIAAGYRYTEAVHRAVRRETNGAVDPLHPDGVVLHDRPGVHPAYCVGETKTVTYHGGQGGWDDYYDSCDTAAKIDWLGYTAAACVAILGDGTLRSMVAGAKNIARDKGVTFAASLLAGGCALKTTTEIVAITDAQRRGNGATIHKVRYVSFTSYPSPHYLTNTTWEAQG